jgi:hypothetical protein
MKITQDKKNQNLYSIEGLTKGKLMAIQNVLNSQKEKGSLTTIQQEILDELNQKLS